MKKISLCMIAILLVAFTLPACSSPEGGGHLEAGQAGAVDQADSKELSIVCTTFPQYDWVRTILGQREADVELTLLLNSGIDLHSYQPSIADIAKISACDLFVYVGGESDAWVDDALSNATNEEMVVINMLEVLGSNVKEEVIVEGMEDEHDASAEQEHAADTPEADEHVWLSLRNAQEICDRICEELEKLDPQNASIYSENTAAYSKSLEQLDAEYQRTVDEASVNTLLFGDRFPFRYLVDDYGLSYYAAFSGCSAETEASFETIIFLANKVDELNLTHVMVTESSDQSIAKTIIENTQAGNQSILVLDSIQSVTAADVSANTSYLAIMESNRAILQEALS